MNAKKAVLFDLDGTLWDSCRVVSEAWTNSLQKRGYDIRFVSEDMRRVMGLPMNEINDRLLCFIEDEKLRQKTGEICAIEENAWLKDHAGDLYDGIEEMLNILKDKGYFLGIVSNCQEGYIEAFLESSRLAGCISDTENYGRTKLSKGQNIRLLLNRNTIDPDDAVYVGDTQGDLDAAKEAGIDFIYAAYGFGDLDEKNYIQTPDMLCGLLDITGPDQPAV